MPYGSQPPPGGPVNPALPTRHPPGSSGKLRVLRARAKARLPLFLPGDAVGPLPPPRPPGPPAHHEDCDLPAGVTRRRRRYAARVTLPGRGRVYLGLFGTVAEAEAAIVAAIEAVRGDAA